MSVTIASLKTNFDTYIGDSSTDRVSDAERYQYLTEATVWLQETLGNEHQDVTYDFDYFDTVHYYKVTSVVPDLTEAVELRREEGLNYTPFAYKSARELAQEISSYATEPSYSIERHDRDAFLAVNLLQCKNKAQQISSFDSLTADGGTWVADTTTSDATNLTIDTTDKKEGTASFNFDIDVSQSVNNRATISNSGLTSRNLSDSEDLASWFFRISIPDVTYFSSVTMYWGSSSSNYWSATTTTDLDGNPFVDGWNRLRIDWRNSSVTGTPDASAITFMRFDFNFTASQADDTDWKIDDLKLAVPETLTLFYTTWFVGTSNAGANISSFTATTDVPFFSGQYDGYRYAIAHMAASYAFYALRLPDQGAGEEVQALKAFNRQRKMFPISKVQQTKSFKPMSVNFRRGRYSARGVGMSGKYAE
jgi:hypothetical protein